VFLAGLSWFFSDFLKLDLRMSVDFWWTRATQPRSLPCSALVARSCGRVGPRSSARGPHALGRLCFLSARVGHAPHFLAVLGGVWGLRRRIFCRVRPDAARVVTPVKLPPYSTAGDFFRVFCLCVVFSHVSMYSLPMCGSSFIRIFLVRGFIVILVRFEILLGSCF
jgi:hypothetical protein